MNNNFKKLLASAMALAMVTSVMPTVATTNVSAAECSYSETEALVKDVIYALKSKGLTIYNAKKADIDEALNSKTVDSSCAESDEAKYLAGLENGLTKLNSLKEGLKEITKVTEIKNKTDYDTNYKTNYTDLFDNEKYLGNVDWSKEEVATFEDNATHLKGLVSDYKEEFYDIYAEEYNAKLKEDFKAELNLDKNGKYVGEKSTTKLQNRLDQVLKSDQYALYSEEAEIIEIVDTLENVIADLEVVDEILDVKSTAAKALRAVRTKVNGLAGLTDEDALEKIDDFSAKDIENVQTYVEEVVNEFYTYETKKRASGRYYVNEEGTDLAAYISDTDVDVNVRKLLTTILDADQKSKDTVYDVLVDTDKTAYTKEDLMNIVKEAKGVTLKWTYTTDEVDTVFNALNALDQLLAANDPYKLNAREERTLITEKSRLLKIAKRMEDAKADIIVTKDWWVFENGQWVFYQDGKVAPNRWVADHNNDWYYAGANGVMLTNAWIARDSKLDVWYYVGADGKMVTNTTVDGCVIDANGVWHA